MAQPELLRPIRELSDAKCVHSIRVHWPAWPNDRFREQKMDCWMSAEVERPATQRCLFRPHPQASSMFHMAWSRSAVQMRGSGWSVASSSARVTSKGMQWSKITHWPYFGFSAAWVSL